MRDTRILNGDRAVETFPRVEGHCLPSFLGHGNSFAGVVPPGTAPRKEQFRLKPRPGSVSCLPLTRKQQTGFCLTRMSRNRHLPLIPNDTFIVK